MTKELLLEEIKLRMAQLIPKDEKLVEILNLLDELVGLYTK